MGIAPRAGRSSSACTPNTGHGEESARARLDVIGGGPGQDEGSPTPSTAPSNTVDVRAPIDGTVVERGANAGLNVEVGTPIFTIADLSTVWVVGELYEQDFARVRLGTKALVTIPGTEPLQGAVSYADPQVSAATRTGKVRVELPNPAQRMRFGMYVDLQLSAAGPPAGGAGVTVPKSAVQTVGDRTVVYVKAAVPGQFSERTVTLGAATGPQVQVIAGLSPGESVVVAGSFFLRAEAERLGVRPTTSTTATEQAFQVTVTVDDFQPSTLTMKAGVPARVTFRRTAEAACATTFFQIPESIASPAAAPPGVPRAPAPYSATIAQLAPPEVMGSGCTTRTPARVRSLKS